LTFRNGIRFAGLADVSRRVVVEKDFIPFAEFAAWSKHHRSIKVFVFDSIQRWDIRKKELSCLVENYPGKLFVFISHIKRNG